MTCKRTPDAYHSRRVTTVERHRHRALDCSTSPIVITTPTRVYRSSWCVPNPTRLQALLVLTLLRLPTRKESRPSSRPRRRPPRSLPRPASVSGRGWDGCCAMQCARSGTMARLRSRRATISLAQPAFCEVERGTGGLLAARQHRVGLYCQPPGRRARVVPNFRWHRDAVPLCGHVRLHGSWIGRWHLGVAYLDIIARCQSSPPPAHDVINPFHTLVGPPSLTCLPDRIQKLKDARSQAAKEIEEYKAQKEAEFKKFESEVSPQRNVCWLVQVLTLRYSTPPRPRLRSPPSTRLPRNSL